jgi:hypothetical protein
MRLAETGTPRQTSRYREEFGTLAFIEKHTDPIGPTLEAFMGATDVVEPTVQEPGKQVEGGNGGLSDSLKDPLLGGSSGPPPDDKGPPLRRMNAMRPQRLERQDARVFAPDHDALKRDDLATRDGLIDNLTQTVDEHLGDKIGGGKLEAGTNLASTASGVNTLATEAKDPGYLERAAGRDENGDWAERGKLTAATSVATEGLNAGLALKNVKDHFSGDSAEVKSGGNKYLASGKDVTKAASSSANMAFHIGGNAAAKTAGRALGVASGGLELAYNVHKGVNAHQNKKTVDKQLENNKLSDDERAALKQVSDVHGQRKSDAIEGGVESSLSIVGGALALSGVGAIPGAVIATAIAAVKAAKFIKKAWDQHKADLADNASMALDLGNSETDPSKALAKSNLDSQVTDLKNKEKQAKEALKSATEKVKTVKPPYDAAKKEFEAAKDQKKVHVDKKGGFMGSMKRFFTRSKNKPDADAVAERLKNAEKAFRETEQPYEHARRDEARIKEELREHTRQRESVETLASAARADDDVGLLGKVGRFFDRKRSNYDADPDAWSDKLQQAAKGSQRQKDARSTANAAKLLEMDAEGETALATLGFDANKRSEVEKQAREDYNPEKHGEDEEAFLKMRMVESIKSRMQ